MESLVSDLLPGLARDDQVPFRVHRVALQWCRDFDKGRVGTSGEEDDEEDTAED